MQPAAYLGTPVSEKTPSRQLVNRGVLGDALGECPRTFVPSNVGQMTHVTLLGNFTDVAVFAAR